MSNVLRNLAAALLVCAGPILSPAHAADNLLPLSGRAEGAATGFLPGPDSVAMTVSAKGSATRLGLFTREETIVLDPSTGTFTGTIAFTAANGDRLDGTLEGGFVAAGTAVGAYSFSGGSGRFENATGDAEFVLSTPNGIDFTVAFEGGVNLCGDAADC